MGVNYCVINITKESSIKEDNCTRLLKDWEYRDGDNTTLEGLDANFITYEVEDYVEHGRQGMDFWNKLGEFVAPRPFPWSKPRDPVRELFPDNIKDNFEEDDYICVIYSSDVCEKIVDYFRRVTFQDTHGPEWKLLTFKFYREYSEIYTLFRIASTDSKKAVMFSID